MASKSRYALAGVFLLCVIIILFALYLQLFKDVYPCPLCVLQRYAFVLIGLASVWGIFVRRKAVPLIAGAVFSLTGIGLSVYQLWTISHPAVQCGKDALEDFVNGLWPARWAPDLFEAEGLCSQALDPFMGLTPPQWALFWFAVFTVFFAWMFFRRRK